MAIILLTAQIVFWQSYRRFADCLHKPFSEEELLAAVSQMDRPDFAAIMEGEENVEEMLDLFIKDTMDELAGIRDAFSTGDYKKLGSIIHKAAPLLEMSV